MEADAQQERRGRGRRGPVAPVTDADRVAAQRAVLDATTDEAQLAALEELLRRSGRASRGAGLPSFFRDPEAAYGPEYAAFRATWFDEVVARPEGRELLRRAVADPRALEGFTSMTLLLYVSDDPVREDFEALLEGLLVAGDDDVAFGTRTRAVGRAAKKLVEGSAADASMLDEVEELFVAWLGQRNDRRAAAALDGLNRLGRAERTAEYLRNLATGPRSDLEVIALLYECRRVLDAPTTPPEVREAALERAQRILERDDEPSAQGNGNRRSSLFASLDAGANARRSALLLLVQLEPVRGAEHAAQTLGSPTRIAQLGMEGIQQLRFALQGKRASLPADARRELDCFFLSVLQSAGARLFEMEEVPLTQEEWQEFFAGKDLRYNAASWFVDQWRRGPDLLEVMGEDPDLDEWLRLLAEADEDDLDAEEGWYYGVEEKAETRLLCAMMRARLAQWEERPVSAELYPLFVEFFAREVGAEVEAAVELALQQQRAGVARIWLEIPERSRPADAYLRDKAEDALELLGCELQRVRGADGSSLRVALPPLGQPPHGE